MEISDVDSDHPMLKLYENSFRPLIRLRGPGYEPVRKLSFYGVIGNIVKSEREIPVADRSKEDFDKKARDKYNLIQIPNAEPIDTRVPSVRFMGSSDGKGVLIHVETAILKKLGRSVIPDITSYHPEQFIGGFKSLLREQHVKEDEDREEETIKIPIHIPIPGYLSKDYLIADEAYDMLTMKKHMETEKYIREALDVIGGKPLSKKRVSVGWESSLSYYSDVTPQLFSQPLPLPETFITKGLGRRVLIGYLVVPYDVKLSITDQRATPSNTENQPYEELLENFVTKVRPMIARNRWSFENSAYQSIKDNTRSVVKMYEERGDRAKALMRSLIIDLQNMLYRMSVVAARCARRTRVRKEDVSVAAIDLMSILHGEVDFILRNVSGDFTYKGLKNEEIICLEILYEKDYTCKDKGISPKEYVELISKKLGVSESTARQTYYYKLKELGFVKSISGRESKVWLTEKGISIINPEEGNLT